MLFIIVLLKTQLYTVICSVTSYIEGQKSKYANKMENLSIKLMFDMPTCFVYSST